MFFFEDLFVSASRVDLNKIPHYITFCLSLQCLLKYVFGSLCIWISPLILQVIHIYFSLFCFLQEVTKRLLQKPVFGVSNKVRLKSVSSAKEASQKTEISPVAKFRYDTF